MSAFLFIKVRLKNPIFLASQIYLPLSSLVLEYAAFESRYKMKESNLWKNPNN